MGWLEDGSFLYTVPGPGVRVHRLPPRPRQRRKPGVLEREHPIPSPDGQYVAIARLAFGERWRIDISRLDGADRWALANDSLWVLNPLWSASGGGCWPLSRPPTPVLPPALINLRTCQVISPLPHLEGNLLDWKP